MNSKENDVGLFNKTEVKTEKKLSIFILCNWDKNYNNGIIKKTI